ncbi:LacI family DNA-binding transcriptional regulator [Arcanobacterium haemolyticum]|uniref:Transcriptional regulator, LacI family n=1 Tax=Arcanobacterium haemolyticum (strain ATCC 9345 / DSM 20595 / CCM 5947 / CCUG 17215 / LMG 16163 / NBRC 15585 / NCTC 8452 / 11018) TaxID=644284 RepID=D7BKK0_ARCHD|nr:LacI family DNA-binding transcriptional regulator [Arcanobacterium haemolyticum]ADH93180.1 transcriptional regulator, LacI family [Arcanobacterium haemolyticum DSM 20595]SQH28062.1 Maltose operon transcriptional repressor [Arcanobacterium haemolyticum]
MATRADVAKRAGVSPSTVSYVLNGQRPTTDETKARVHQAISDLGYVPNQWAGNLAARSLRTIGLHLSVEAHGIDDVTSEYIVGMKERAQELGISLILPVIGETAPEEFRRFLRSKTVDALIMMEVGDRDWRENIVLDESFPAVFLGSPGTKQIPFVESDFIDIGKKAVDYIAQRGHKNSLLVVRDEARSDFQRTSALMIEGVIMSASENGVSNRILRAPSHSIGALDVLDLLAKTPEHTVVMGDNYGVLSSLVSLSPRFGMTIGENYSVVSFAGSYPLVNGREKVISESSTDHHQMGRMCVDKVVARFNGEDTESTFSLQVLQIVGRCVNRRSQYRKTQISYF